MNIQTNTNIVNLSGTIATEFKLNHVINDKKFYSAEINIERISGVVDTIPFTVNEKLINLEESYVGKHAEISGCLRAFNNHNIIDDKRKLIIIVSAKTFKINDEYVDKELFNKNEIVLEGYICKEPVLRVTPFSERTISDVIIAVNRPYMNTDYVPCICWGGLAKFVNRLKVGSYISIIGRIQSRQYNKKLDNDEYEVRTAYEVSIGKLVLNNNKKNNQLIYRKA